MNEQSSRSHFVFTMRISGFNEVIMSLPSGVGSCIVDFLSYFEILYLSPHLSSFRALNSRYKVFST